MLDFEHFVALFFAMIVCDVWLLNKKACMNYRTRTVFDTFAMTDDGGLAFLLNVIAGVHVGV